MHEILNSGYPTKVLAGSRVGARQECRMRPAGPRAPGLPTSCVPMEQGRRSREKQRGGPWRGGAE